jgi:hypothetical protein
MGSVAEAAAASPQAKRTVLKMRRARMTFMATKRDSNNQQSNGIRIQ